MAHLCVNTDLAPRLLCRADAGPMQESQRFSAWRLTADEAMAFTTRQELSSSTQPNRRFGRALHETCHCSVCASLANRKARASTSAGFQWGFRPNVIDLSVISSLIATETDLTPHQNIFIKRLDKPLKMCGFLSSF